MTADGPYADGSSPRRPESVAIQHIHRMSVDQILLNPKVAGRQG